LPDRRNQLLALLITALALRLVFLLGFGHPFELGQGGDQGWYLQNGIDLVHTAEAGPLNTGPAYLIMVGVAGSLLPRASAILVIKLLQALMGTATVSFVYLAGRRVWNHRVGMGAGAAIAAGPAFILGTDEVLTETLFIFLFTAALAWYAWRTAPRDMAAVGVLLGLATLTRPVLLAFPAAVIVHLALKHGRRAIRPAAMLLLAFALTLAPWTLYNLARWDRFVIAGQGFTSFLYFGAQDEGWIGPEASDAAIGVEPGEHEDRDYASRATATIRADPVGWAMHRLRSLGDAVLQPHGTVYFAGESLKDAATRWLRDDRSLSGLADLARQDAFWPKLALYVFHFAALAGGVVGMILSRRRWREAFLLYAGIGYFLAVHLVLYAIPRYLFPTEALWWLFAAAAIARLVPAWRRAPITDQT
jgi:4-amino-4-deoxy-L-arabinose transferase-like glycosyltransferase